MKSFCLRLTAPVILLMIGSLLACNTPATQADGQNSPQTAAGSSGTSPDGRPQPGKGNPSQSIPAEARPGDAQFPYVELAGGKSLRFEAYDMVFQLTHAKPLFPLTNDQVKWIKQGDADQNMGNFITYIFETGEKMDISLANPYISVQYFARNNPDCPDCKTPQSVLKAFQTMYKNTPGFKAGPLMEVATSEGKKAICQEMYIPKIKLADGSGIKDEKYIGYAYIEYNENWMIGMALTTASKGEYDRSKNPFFDLVATYVELGNFPHSGPPH